MKKQLLITLAYSASLCFATKIGVLSTPEYKSPGSCIPDETVIFMDTENHNDKTGIVAGNQSPIGYNPVSHWFKGVEIREGISRFTFCAIDVDQKKMPRVKFDYMVLRLDSKCPEGTFPVRRHHDTEDDTQKNKTWGNVWPNVVSKDIDFEFCFVPKDSKASLGYPFDKKYGVFANPDAKWNIHIAHTQIHIDDEDSNNKNKWEYYDKKNDQDFKDKVNKIMNGTKDTDYHFIKWVDIPNPVVIGTFAKQANPESFEKTYIAATPLAPAIKALNHSVIVVELKSAGDVKISIIDVSGAVIANITEKNLQPGIHQIKWNAGIRSSGRHIVKIAQNGLVNAKNIILK